MDKKVVINGVSHPAHMAYTHEQLAEDLKTGHTVISSTFPPTQDGTVPSIKVGRVVGLSETVVGGVQAEAVGSGSERWPNVGWTETGDGTNYPGLPTQAQADAVVAQAESERTSAVKLPAPQKSESEKNAASIDQDLHPEKYEEPA